MSDTCECDNEPSDSMKCREFLDWLKTGQRLKKDSAPWSKYTRSYIKLTTLTYLQDEISPYHQDPDRYLYTQHIQQTSNYELVPVTAITYVNKNATRCSSMQIFIYFKVTLHVSGVTAPIIRSTKNCNRSLRYRS